MDKAKTARLEGFVLKEAEDFFRKQGFIPLFPPKIVRASGACENINTLFEVSVDKNHKWFDRNSYLSQTGQLYLEAMVPELKKVYCVGPSFRAEPKIDSRHLTEFTMLEIEFAGNFEDLLAYEETLIHHVAKKVVQHPKVKEDFGLSDQDIQRLNKCPNKFQRFTYDQAITKLQEIGEAIKWGDDINSNREKLLLATVDNQPFFITHYPDPMYEEHKNIEVEKFFNMLPSKDNPGRVLSSDLILPFGGEAVGAAARVHILDELVKRLKNSKMYKRLQEKGGDISDFEWYINHIEKNGAVPHAGCGFGMSRILQYISGKTDITEAVTFPSNKGLLI
ncbi:MAG: amino acid--tRNA ligase-related protein [Patescibacteria group bacterium]|jgi:asparaginyl-tRNA synthetase